MNGGKTFDNVIHIGAHLAEEKEDYEANGVKQVYWAEANPLLFNKLKQQFQSDVNNWSSIQTNKTKHQMLTSEPLAFFNKNSKVNFHITNNGQSSSILSLGTHKEHYPHIHVTEEIEVQAIRFDEYYEKLEDKPTFNFINLDVQGVEYEVLEGFGDHLSKPELKAIYSEVNFEEVYVGAHLISDIDQLLEKFGFKRVLTERTQYNWGDALYLKP